MIVDEIRALVIAACDEPANALTPAFYEEHVRVVGCYAALLAARLGADAEVVELAALLHDYAAVLDLSTLPDHPAAGARLARTLLVDRQYPEARAELVADAILRHSQPIAVGGASAEAVCLSNADAMAQIAMPVYWLFFAFRVRGLDYETGKRWYAERVRQNWEALIPEARTLLADRHAHVARALAGTEA